MKNSSSKYVKMQMHCLEKSTCNLWVLLLWLPLFWWVVFQLPDYLYIQHVWLNLLAAKLQVVCLCPVSHLAWWPVINWRSSELRTVKQLCCVTSYIIHSSTLQLAVATLNVKAEEPKPRSASIDCLDLMYKYWLMSWLPVWGRCLEQLCPAIEETEGTLKCPGHVVLSWIFPLCFHQALCIQSQKV